MMDGASPSEMDAVRACADAYGEAVCKARADVFADLCHARFLMTAVAPDGSTAFWDKAAYLERVAGRDPFPGAPSYEILSVDTAGGEIARVHLWVDVPPRRYEDHLGFVREHGEWKLITKVFRTLSGPEREG